MIPSVKVNYALICDDVRVEDNGKQILIGVYTGGMVFASFPARATVTVWCDLEFSEPGEYLAKVEAALDKDKILFAADAMLSLGSEKRGILGLRMPLRFENPGQLRIALKVSENDWMEIKSIPVTLRAPSIEQQPLF